jgi:amino acid adenylation domain-containing protein
VLPANAWTAFAPQDIGQSIGQRFEQQAALHPERVAVLTPERRITYDGLDRAANRAARAIRDAAGVGRDPVALLFANDAAFVTASLACAKAGAIQVPLDATFPEARLRYMLEHSGAGVVVTDAAHEALARALAPRRLIDIERVDTALPDTRPGSPPAADAPAAIGYTSGSTGRPKGIVWNHRGVLHAVMRHTNTYRIAETDRLAMFRATVRPALYALLNGATYCPVTLRGNDPGDLAAWFAAERVTVYRGAVSVFRSFVASLGRGQTLPDVRLVLLFGEAVYPSDVEACRRHFPHALLGSSLGCNEFDDYACIFVDPRAPLPQGPLPGGYPMGATRTLIVDEEGNEAGTGEVGEIVIRSAYNAMGYWRDAELTHAAFLHDPEGGDERCYRTGDLGRRGEDGCLFHHGRRDFDVKILGQRVDVAEVEAALLALDGVRAAAVVGRERTPGTSSLAAFIVAAGAPPPRSAGLRRALRERLPDYMVPASFVFVESLPLTATGKIDRRALPAPPAVRPAIDTPFAVPRSETERAIAAIWAEVLGIDAVGAHDAFLDLGGDSLLAAQIAARVVDRLHVALSPAVLLDAATVAAMAEWVERAAAAPPLADDLSAIRRRR